MRTLHQRAVVKVLTLHQPWASLIALGVKTIETRSWRAPTSLIGGRIAIHAAIRPCPIVLFVGDYHVAQGGTWIHGGLHDQRMPFGAIVATAVLADCLPMVGASRCKDATAHLCIVNESMLAHSPLDAPWRDGETERVVSDQRPYGDFRPGRWAWLLADVEPLDKPVPFRGGQGLSREWTI